ncbi:hypothetical protein [Gordonia phage Tarzan]|uniref:Uncharacterized protein n=1 Tax=Gordonia phage Tarzan TaxID=3038367 RepID=A0AAF0GEW3_9CAUD|nr:hypothetical protein QLQ76_gp49 [Gordonia phage Tarzan]WGH20083.1 hypothetical protein [Gordonia phage Tarzan]
MTLEHLTTVTAAESVLDDTGETWTIRLVDPRRTAYGIQRVTEVDPRRVPMHVLEAVMVWAHAGLNPDIDDATDPPTDPPTEDIVDAEIVDIDEDPHECPCGGCADMARARGDEDGEGGFYCVACGHTAHAPDVCGVTTPDCGCDAMQEAPRS